MDTEPKTVPKQPAIIRPESLQGATYKVKLDHLPNAFYIIINNIDLGKGLMPYEIFINSLDPEALPWFSLVSRLVSAFFRTGRDTKFIVKELKEVFEANDFWYKGKRCLSVAEVIGEVIEEHCQSIGYKL